MSQTKDAPAFDFYPERFWFAVEGWSDSDITRYWRLLGQQWMRDGLPESVKELEALARGRLSSRVLDKFPVGDDGKRRNSFLEKLRGEQRFRISKRRLGAEKTNAKRHAERIGERHAERPIERDASDTPPPTTHHPPLVATATTRETSSPPLPVGTAFPTLEQAMGYAESQAQRKIKPEWVEKWWLDRERKGWNFDTRSGNQVPISDWRADLQFYAKSWQETDDKAAAKERLKAEKSAEKKNGKTHREPESQEPVTQHELPPVAPDFDFQAAFAASAEKRRLHEEWLATPHGEDEASPYLP